MASPSATLLLQIPNCGHLFVSTVAPLALVLAAPLPSLAVPSPLVSPTTPFSQSKDLRLGLDDGKIRPCPSTNPRCVSTNPMSSSSFAFPWVVPKDFSSSDDVVQKLREAISKTQKNVKFTVYEDTPEVFIFDRSTTTALRVHPYIPGHYLAAEIDGGFERDVIEFLVKKDFVGYRSVATKVTYVYPFTTALGDNKGQLERMKQISEQLGLYAPSFELMDD